MTQKKNKEEKEVSSEKEQADILKPLPYLQNRELSWLAFNERVLNQGSDKTVPLLERLKFVSIFWSNLQEFFMVRVGSLTDLSLLKKTIIDQKSMMTPAQQIEAIHKRCHELYPVYESTFLGVEEKLAAKGIKRLEPNDLNDEQRKYVQMYAKANIEPYLAPQVVNVHHPFPHLESGALYAISNLAPIHKKDVLGTIPGFTLGLIPVPARCDRIIKLPGKGCPYILVEHVIEMLAPDIFSMYETRKTNIICVTRNADLDALEGIDEEIDFREHMKKILKKRARLAAVRLDAQWGLSEAAQVFLKERLNLTDEQIYVSAVPLDMSYAYALPGIVDDELSAALSYVPFNPTWPRKLDSQKSIFEQVEQHDVLCTYPFETMDTFLQLIREAVRDPEVVSIKITLYRLATKSRLAELLMEAAEAGKDVTLLFELRARFDEGNNIEWSQRCEEAGCKVIYGFRDYKVHSKICLITRKTSEGMRYITQIGTGNYNEKTATLYTDYSFMTADYRIGRDATVFFQNVGIEAISDTYEHLKIAPLQIKQMILKKLHEQEKLAKEGMPCGVFFKTNSVTDFEIIKAISKASKAGVPITLLVRGISCLVPGVKGYTDNVRVVSVVGRLLEHSRIYAFGPLDDCELYISSADLMTRNMNRRVEIACPIYEEDLRKVIVDQVRLYMSDTVKLRELLPDCLYTPLGKFVSKDSEGKKIHLDAQEALINDISRCKAEETTETESDAPETDIKDEVAELTSLTTKPEDVLTEDAPVVTFSVEAAEPQEAAAADASDAVDATAGAGAAKGAEGADAASEPKASGVQAEAPVEDKDETEAETVEVTVSQPPVKGVRKAVESLSRVFGKIAGLFKRK